MNNWKVIVATVVIFGAGVLTGGWLVNYVNHSHAKPVRRPAVAAEGHVPNTNQANRPADPPKPRPQDILSKQFISQLDEFLRLTPEQHAVIGKIVAEGQEQNRTISTNTAAQIRKVLQEVRQFIKDELTPAQRKQFEELLKQRPAKSNVADRLEGIKQRETLRLGANALPGSEEPATEAPSPPLGATNSPAANP